MIADVVTACSGSFKEVLQNDWSVSGVVEAVEKS